MKKNIILVATILIILIHSSVFAQEDILYVVQAGYYKNKTLLEKDFKTMADKGLPVYKVSHNGGHRIYVGDYTSKEDAEKVAEKVKEIGFEVLVRTKPKVHPNPEQGATPEMRQNEKALPAQVEEEPAEKEDTITIPKAPDVKPVEIPIEPQEIKESPEHHEDSTDTVREEQEIRRKMLRLCLLMIGVMGSIGIMAAINRNC